MRLIFILIFSLSFLSGCISQFDAPGSISLSWLPPTERENGERLFEYEIYGYLVAYQNTSTNSSGVEEVSVDGSNTSTTLTRLESGVYEVKVAAIDINGLYSQFSDSILISIP